MATSEEIKNALIGQLATFNGSSTEEQAMASENIGKIYVPTNEDVIIINKRRVGCGRNATTEKDGLMSATDKKALKSVKTDIGDLQRAVGENIPNTYATKEEVEADFTAVNNSLAIASSTATEALGKANDAKGKVDNIISGTTVVPTATNAQEAQKATQDGSGNEITKTYATKAELKTTNDSLGTTAATANDAKSKVDKIISGETVVKSATNAQTAQTATNLANKPTLAKGTNDTNAVTVTAGGKKSDEFVVPYATTADKATKDGSGNNIVNTYATKEELNDKLNASDAMVLAGSISGTGVIQKHNDNVVSQNVKEGTTNISALTDYKAGWTWRVVSDGTITDIGKVESGDMVMCVSDYKSAYKASDWTAIQRNIDLATSNSSGLMSATDKANLDAALIQLDGIDTKISNIEGDITNIENDLTNTYATKTEMGAVEDKADAAQSTANEAKSIANSLVDGTTKAKEAETADSATKATQDGNGKVIDDTYALRGEAVATQDLGKYVPVNKHTGGTLAFPLATQSAGGAMSSDDKKKLDDTEGTYYSSFNVTGSGWYRLVNVPVARWLDKYLVVDIVNAAGSSASNSFKIYYNSPMGWGDERSNSFICAPLTRTNKQCVGDVRLVYKGGAPAQYIDAYIILPEGTTNLSVCIKSNIDAKYLAKNPVGADGKEGVAEAVTIALPDGYGSIVRNAYVGCLTSDDPRRVVGGLYSERSLQDINGNRIDAQYATKTEMNSYLPETLANGGYINTLQESSNAQFIPFFQNELAHLIERGGSVSVAINGTEYTRGDNVAGEATERKKFFDGCNSYYQIGSSSLGLQDTVTITINLPNSYRYAGTIYCLMPNIWRGRNVKFELFYPSLNNGAGEWHTMYEGTKLSDGLVYQPIKTLYDANGNVLVPTGTAWTKLRVTITNFISTDTTLRIAEIGYVSYAAKNSTAICLPRNGGEIYGGITPLNDSSYDLGASGKAWKNVYGKQLTSTAADGTAPLVVSSKTMVANLNAQYARMLFGSSNSPLNVGNYFTPVYFNGGVPTSCKVLNNNKNFGGIPYVSDGGYFPIGKMLQFHTTSDEDTNKNANLRIKARDANDANGEGLTIGGTTIASGKFAQHSGYICCNTASLSSYWGKLWELNHKSRQKDLDVTIYIHSAFYDRRGIVHLRVRFEAKKNEDGTYTEGSHIIFINQIVGNLTLSIFRLYYKCDINASTGSVTNGQIELWCNVAGQYGVYNAVLLSATSRAYKEDINYYGTFSQTTFTTVQTPTLPNYVEMTNIKISQTADKALAADKAYNADNAVYLRTTNVTSNNKDFPILWAGNETLNTEQVNSNVYRSYNDLSYNPSKKRITTGLFKGCLESVDVPSAEGPILQYVSSTITIGEENGNSKEGSHVGYNYWCYPAGVPMTYNNGKQIQTLRFKWSDDYFHDIFMTPTKDNLYHRRATKDTATPWMKIVEATEDGKVVIEGTTQEDTLRIKNKDRSTGEIHIFNGEQGNAVIRHYEGSQTTDLKFNSTQVMHGSKSLAYSSDVTALQKEIANLKKTVQEQATLIEALQSALTWE